MMMIIIIIIISIFVKRHKVVTSDALFSLEYARCRQQTQNRMNTTQ